jgi:hypothetical protein
MAEVCLWRQGTGFGLLCDRVRTSLGVHVDATTLQVLVQYIYDYYLSSVYSDRHIPEASGDAQLDSMQQHKVYYVLGWALRMIYQAQARLKNRDKDMFVLLDSLHVPRAECDLEVATLTKVRTARVGVLKSRLGAVRMHACAG